MAELNKVGCDLIQEKVVSDRSARVGTIPNYDDFLHVSEIFSFWTLVTFLMIWRCLQGANLARHIVGLNRFNGCDHRFVVAFVVYRGPCVLT